MHVKRGHRWLFAIVALAGAAALPAARAQESGGRFEVRNAYVELVNGT